MTKFYQYFLFKDTLFIKNIEAKTLVFSVLNRFIFEKTTDCSLSQNNSLLFSK